MSSLRCGDVVWADLDPSCGHEQAKRRPLIVVSNDNFNRHCALTMAIPITCADTGYPLHVSVGVVPTEGPEPPITGFAEVEQLKSLDLRVHNAVHVGTIGPEGMDKILSLVLGCLVTPDMSIISGC